MELHTKVNTHKERNTVKENSHGLIKAHSLEISSITIFMVLVFMNGLMAEYILEIGRTIKWKVMEPSHGQMAESM